MSVGLLEAQVANIPLTVFGPVGLVDMSASGNLQTSIAEIAERLTQELDDIAEQVISAPTAKEFCALREALLPSYVKLSIALGNVVSAKIDKAELPSLIRASFDALEAEFTSEAPAYFGDDAYQEIIFSVSTLKSAYRWLPSLLSVEVAEELRQQDMELAREFNGASIWANFHLQALVSLLRQQRTAIPEVLESLLEGLRHSVMVYAYVRQALDLRHILDERYSEELAVSWDDEDGALAKAD